jgi:superfamily II DNA helicase RecQ
MTSSNQKHNFVSVLYRGISVIVSTHNSYVTCSQGNKSCGIIYCRTREATEEVATYLTRKGVQTVAYHAGSILALSNIAV